MGSALGLVGNIYGSINSHPQLVQQKESEPATLEDQFLEDTEKAVAKFQHPYAFKEYSLAQRDAQIKTLVANGDANAAY